MKDQINARVQKRYDELMAEGRHGHYETMFQIVNDERAKVLEKAAKWHDSEATDIRRQIRLADIPHGVKICKIELRFHEQAAAAIRKL